MFNFKFNRLPRPQQFKYVPRHYDPRTERIQEVLDKYKNPGKEKPDVAFMKSRISRSFSRPTRPSYTTKQSRTSTIRLVIIFFALLALTYALMSSNADFLLRWLG